MGKGSPNLVVPPTDTTEDIFDLTVEANLIVPTDAHANAYELRNELLLQRRLRECATKTV